MHSRDVCVWHMMQEQRRLMAHCKAEVRGEMTSHVQLQPLVSDHAIHGTSMHHQIRLMGGNNGCYSSAGSWHTVMHTLGIQLITLQVIRRGEVLKALS